MWNLKMIYMSISKQGTKIKLLTVQLFFIFLAFNVAFILTSKTSEVKKGIESLINTDTGMKIAIVQSTMEPEEAEEKLQEVFNKIKNNPNVDKLSTYSVETVNLNQFIKDTELNKKINTYLIDADTIDFYNFSIEEGNNINFDNISNDKIPVLVGSALSKDLPLNTSFTTKELVNNHWVSRNYIVTGILSDKQKFWSNYIGGLNTISDMKHSIIIPIWNDTSEIDFNDKIEMLTRNINLECKDKEAQQRLIEDLSDMKTEDYEVKFITMDKFVKQIEDNNKL